MTSHRILCLAAGTLLFISLGVDVGVAAPARQLTPPRSRVYLPHILSGVELARPFVPTIRDGMALVPAGELATGTAPGQPGDPAAEQPWGTVGLDDYWIDVTEVTNTAFARFVDATGHRTRPEITGESRAFADGCHAGRVAGADWRHPRGPGSDLAELGDHPVVHVAWADASAYCSWMGKRLPTEAEWEKAAGGWSRTYPWGDAPASGDHLNFADASMAGCLSYADTTIFDGFALTAPVGHYPAGASPYGVLDMSGNVWEWVADQTDTSAHASSPGENGLASVEGTAGVLRGGSFSSVPASDARTTSRYPTGSTETAQVVGFRCAR